MTLNADELKELRATVNAALYFGHDKVPVNARLVRSLITAAELNAELVEGLERIVRDAPDQITNGKSYKSGFDNGHYWAANIARALIAKAKGQTNDQ